MKGVLNRRLWAVILMVLLISPAAWAATKRSSSTVTARAAILSDSTNAKRLYGKNVNLRVPPASTTKVMTALLVLERLSLTDVVTVTEAATRAQPSKINLQAGERYKVEDLLYALLLNSANDASIVLAQAVAGTEWEFARLMNARAKQLGAKNTHFANSNGLPTRSEAQYTTPYDMYLIFRAALKYDFFQEAISYRYKTIQSLGGRTIALKSHNRLLFTDWGKRIYGKTGYTRAAKACFVGYVKNGKRTLIIGVFGCTKRWEDVRLILRRFGGIPL